MAAGETGGHFTLKPFGLYHRSGHIAVGIFRRQHEIDPFGLATQKPEGLQCQWP